MRARQAFSKLLFCLRVAADTKTFLRLVIQSKKLDRFQKKDVAATRPYAGDPALAYRIRYLSFPRTIYLRTFAGDIRIFYELFWERMYSLPAAAAVAGESGMVRSGGPAVVVDAGAHVGMAALYFSFVYPRAKIYCIEPDARNFFLLEKNLAPLVGEGRALLLQAALYDRDGSVGIVGERWGYNSRVDEGRYSEGGDGPETVRAVSPEGLLREWQLERIDLLKIDIEGAEDKIFSGELAWLQQVRTILLELHRVRDIGPIRSKLEENGFRWQRWDRGSEGEGSLFLASRAEITRLAGS